MSLINQVLKDLEKRHASVNNVGAMTRAVRPLPEERSRRGLWVGLAVILIGVIAAAGTWWVARSGDSSPVIAAQKSLAPAPAAAAGPTNGSLPQPPQPVVGKPDGIQSSAIPPGAAKPVQLNGTPAPVPAAGSATSRLVPTPEPAATPVNAPPKPQLSASAAASVPPASQNAQPNAAPGTASKKNEPPATAANAAARSSELLTVGTSVTPKGESSTLLTSSQSTPAPAADADHPTTVTKPGPTAARIKARSGPSPKISAPAQNSEYPDPLAAQTDSNIEKQVRPQSDRDRAEASFRQGMSALEGGGVAEAEASLREALRLDPMVDRARQALLGIYLEAGRREDAEHLLEARLQLDHKHYGFAMALARLQLERGSNADALVTLQRSLPYGENSADYQAMLANALSRLGRHKEAAERYDAASGLAPRNPLWQMGLGVELRSDSRIVEARVAFKRARELGGLNPQLTAYLDQQLRELQ